MKARESISRGLFTFGGIVTISVGRESDLDEATSEEITYAALELRFG